MVAAAAPILNVEMGSSYIPKDNPSKPLGEDAHFVISDKNTAGVADGVGGWALKGIDAGEYARDHMRNCVASVVGAEGIVYPKRVMTEAHSRTTAAGSSTACLISFDGWFLRAANLGDSGFMIFRGEKLVYRSPVQRRGFNCPYQMGTREQFDKPTVAWSGKIRMEAGDIIVVGTDGLLDNVFEREIVELLAAEVAETAVDLATMVAELAWYNSLDSVKDGPFAVEARKAGRSHCGGKIDDITVVVAKVTASSFSHG
ncbi:probable protein phosphatase 2C 55 [Cucumis sativus]|uniref:Protein phosphatase n=1 Tax=Cucumis sativus TaxID=3659 RepID=A0A0A0L4K6_CUCSA|nr:probable protein phosphatase 2C 55 [Cucumis sativus]KGN55061.1 hypothetical protein Csa_012064 [Cucumis sativus]